MARGLVNGRKRRIDSVADGFCIMTSYITPYGGEAENSILMTSLYSHPDPQC